MHTGWMVCVRLVGLFFLRTIHILVRPVSLDLRPCYKPSSTVQIEGRKARATKAGRCAKGKRQQGKQYKPLTVGTVKYAVFHVLSQAGPAGLTIKEIVAQINVS
jgi:hypothetical protein